jgi:hypothetical protein
MRYEVIVGNVGSVYNGDSEASARAVYNSYVRAADGDVGRAAGKDVTLLGDHKIIESHPSRLHDDGED